MTNDNEAPDSDSEVSEMSSAPGESARAAGDTSASPAAPWQPIPAKQRRILGVLMEKAKSTPDVYPLSLASLVSGVNQKSNRYPLMNLTPEQVEDELSALRRIGAAAEVHGTGRVARYRHYGHNWLGVKGVEAAVMIELLLRGQQTAGDLRARAGRFEPIPDLATLHKVLDALMARNLVIALTPSGRGQLFTHNLYTPDELYNLRLKISRGGDGTDEGSEEDGDEEAPAAASSAIASSANIARPVATSPAPVSSYASTVVPTQTSASSPGSSASAPAAAVLISEVQMLKDEVADLRATVEALRKELSELRAFIES